MTRPFSINKRLAVQIAYRFGWLGFVRSDIVEEYLSAARERSGDKPSFRRTGVYQIVKRRISKILSHPISLLDPTRLIVVASSEDQTSQVNVPLVAYVAAALSGILGVVLSPIFAIAMMAIGQDVTLLALISPLFLAIVGFVCGGIVAWLYNLVAKEMYGPEPEVRERSNNEMQNPGQKKLIRIA